MTCVGSLVNSSKIRDLKWEFTQQTDFLLKLIANLEARVEKLEPTKDFIYLDGGIEGNNDYDKKER